MTKLFCSKTNQAVTLTVSIAQSGEGEVWRTDRSGLLAKIYHVPESNEKEKLAQMKDRVAKLEVMVKRVPKDPNAHQNHISFAWPRSLLKNSGGEVVGFLMPEVENSLDLLKVCTPRMRKSLGIDANWYFLHVVARNIAGIIQAIHDEGYVLGDIKLQNILVNNRALPTIIDTDSFQVVDPIQNKVYRCLVASEGFTPSELIGKNIDSITQSAVHDRFRLGVVIYYLLFGGPPFRGSWQGSGDPPEQVELIRRGYWPYAPNSLIQPNHNTIPLDIIHSELQRCFLLCFNDGHFNPSKRPSARVWLDALEVAFNELQSCGKVDSHFYGLSYGRCYWCDRAQNLGIDIFSDNAIKKPKPVKQTLPIPPQVVQQTVQSQSIQKTVQSLPIQIPPVSPLITPTSSPLANKGLSRRQVMVGLGVMGLVGFGWQIKNSKPPLPIITKTLPGDINLEMVQIPGGQFMMGSPDSDPDATSDEKPQHQVKLKGFAIGKYPVTQEQYQAIMGNNQSLFQDNSKNPVERVSWNDAQEFCQELSQMTGQKYRLPTEAEWEYACRAGTQTRFYFGDDEKQLEEYAWYRGNSVARPHPVGQKKPNNWGLFDMSGNVWEWCEDRWHENYENAPKDGSSWNDNYSQSSSRVQRGGSWYLNSKNCRSANRDWLGADYRDKDVGFRLVLFLL